jgi:hypothetical protein
VWRLFFDAGNAGGPLLIGVVTAAAALGPAVVTMGLVAVLGAGAMHRWIPPLPNR